MAKFPAVTLIIPSYNRGNYIEDTIESILVQNYPNLNIIVVDTHSTDDTSKKLAKYSQRIKMSYLDKSCYLSAVNYGVEKCTTDIFCILQAGDLINTGLIEAAVEAFSQSSDLSCVYPDIINISPQGRVISHDISPDYDFYKILEEHFSLEVYGGFFRKSKLAGMTFYESHYGPSAHYEMCLRLGLTGSMKHLSDAFVVKRNLPPMLPFSLSEPLKAESRIQVIQDLYTRKDLPAEIHQRRHLAMSAAYYQAAIVKDKGVPKNKFMAASLYHKIRWPSYVSQNNRRKTSEILLAIGNPLTSWIYNTVKKAIKRT